MKKKGFLESQKTLTTLFNSPRSLDPSTPQFLAMADSNPPAPASAPADAVADATASVEKLHLDEVTGEMVSKTELKKRAKKREKESQKQAKQPPAAQGQKKAKSAEEDESNLSPNQVF